ncbi:CmcI family methyltransferase [Oleisolibacter albus]|uniref:CmcI family methyltransferase n=1 Tax=Oleisolibacter albus TaxID=2171757 RepID=UPI001EFEDE1C|nr:CmcI family methyltransferase [Oleisolibacter albus]
MSPLGDDLSAHEQDVVQAYMRLVHQRFIDGRRSLHCDWLGRTAIKYPTDLWIYQEIIVRRRPDLIVECGTHKGGSALFLASVCDLVGHGRVVSIDLRNGPGADLPAHPRLEFLAGSTTSPEILDAVRARAAASRNDAGPDAAAPEVLVILDSDHRLLHVLDELEAYAPLVRPGGYLIAEDTHVNGRPNQPEHGPGPAEAAAFFLARHPEFEVDRSCERFLLSLNAGGYLRRRETAADGGTAL